MASFESSLERDWLMALDFDWRVQRVQEQPFSIKYQVDGSERRYTPDILAEFNDGTRSWITVFEVKGEEDLCDNWATYKPRFKAAVSHCRANGWRFKIVTERLIRTNYVANVKFLRKYRELPSQEMHRNALLHTMTALGETTPQALIAATWNDFERRMGAIVEMWRLLANREFAADLSTPLTMQTPIWKA